MLIGREEIVKEQLAAMGQPGVSLEIHNARVSDANRRYTDFLYRRLQRKGALLRDCQRMVNQDRNVFAALMVAQGDAHAMVTGVTRTFGVAFEEISRVIDAEANETVFGLHVFLSRNRTVFIADTTVHVRPDGQTLADIAIGAAAKARQMGHEPRVALLSFSNFGQNPHPNTDPLREAVAILDNRRVDFEYDGEMSADVALDHQLMKRVYPFCRLSGPANVLVMPGLHSANITAKLLNKMAGGQMIGPLLIGLDKPVQIVSMGSTVGDLVTAAALAAHDSLPW